MTNVRTSSQNFETISPKEFIIHCNPSPRHRDQLSRLRTVWRGAHKAPEHWFQSKIERFLRSTSHPTVSSWLYYLRSKSDTPCNTFCILTKSLFHGNLFSSFKSLTMISNSLTMINPPKISEIITQLTLLRKDMINSCGWLSGVRNEMLIISRKIFLVRESFWDQSMTDPESFCARWILHGAFSSLDYRLSQCHSIEKRSKVFWSEDRKLFDVARVFEHHVSMRWSICSHCSEPQSIKKVGRNETALRPPRFRNLSDFGSDIILIHEARAYCL